MASSAAASENPDTAEVEGFRRQVDDLISKTDQLEKKVKQVVGHYDRKKNSSSSREKQGRLIGSSGKDGGSCSKKMQELIRQFGMILRQITKDKRAGPFMNPVDVKGLGLHDYYQIIKTPMDFCTIQSKMEGKDGNKYKSIREIYSDVRLVFTNAMTYNDDHHDYHLMAKTLLEKFEEKWLQLLPKVVEEETRQKEEESQKISNMTNQESKKKNHEADIAKLAKDTEDELNEINMHLDELRKMVIQRCRKMSTDEKRKLGAGLCHLSPEDLNKALEIVAEDNQNFQSAAEEVDLDMDAQSETTLWKLKFFVKEALERQANGGKADENAKRKREICNALAKTASKRTKKPAEKLSL